MKIRHEQLLDVNRFIENNSNIKLEDQISTFETLLKRIGKFKVIDEQVKIIEIGTGAGLFPIFCKKEGINCKGLEISPHLVELAKEFGEKYGVEPEIELGNIEETDIGISYYDVIIAEAVFEHVEYWQEGIKRIFNALKPGGLFVFTSTNKFALTSGEFNFPLYGWLPDRWRYRLRRYLQGDDIMKWGIDFNQFTCFQLRNTFKDIGFSEVYDWIEFVDPEVLANPSYFKKTFIKILKTVKPTKPVALFFSPLTSFMCIK